MRSGQRLRGLRFSRVAILALLPAINWSALADGCDWSSSHDAAEIHARRTEFNEAIAARRIEVIADVLAEDVVLVTGTDSEVLAGREAQLATWRDDFRNARRAVYVRSPDCIRVFNVTPIALEYGHWRGEREAARKDFATGRYTAKWRRIDGRWRLEAEVFATEACAGDFCPDAVSPPN